MKFSKKPHRLHLGSKHYSPLQCPTKGPQESKLFHVLQQRHPPLWHGQCCYGQHGICPQECPHPLLSSKDPCPFCHPEPQLLGTSGTGSGTLVLNMGKQNIWRSSSRAERRPGTNGWIHVWVSFFHWANLLSLPWFYFVSNLGIQAPHQDGNKLYRRQCSHHRESSSTGGRVIAGMSLEDYSSAWNEPVVAGKVRRISQKQVPASEMGFRHWENLDLHICKLFGDCFPLKVLWKQPATTGSCSVVLRGGDYIWWGRTQEDKIDSQSFLKEEWGH